MRSKWRKYILSSAMVFYGAYAGGLLQGVFAQETAQPKEVSRSEMEDLKWQLGMMEGSAAKQQEQIQALRERVQAINAEVGKAKSYTAEASKEEFKHAIDDYLSTDEARKKMALGLPGTTAAYTPDDEKYTLILKTPDEKYTLAFGARAQFRYMFKDKDEDFEQTDVNDLSLRRARVYFGGNVYTKFVHYYVELDADKFNVGLRDFYIYVTPLEELNGKFGFFKVPFNRQRMTTSGKLLFMDRSIANDEFTQDRDYGVDIYGKPFEGHIEYHAAVFQGAGQNFQGLNKGDNIDNKLMPVLSLRYNPFGKYDYYDETDVKYTESFKATIGASVAFNGKVQDVKLRDSNTTVGIVDLGMRYKGFTWDSDYFARTVDPENGGNTVDSDGFYTQAGYFVIPHKLETESRYSMVHHPLDPNTVIVNGLQREYTMGINYYFRDHQPNKNYDVTHLTTTIKEGINEENR